MSTYPAGRLALRAALVSCAGLIGLAATDAPAASASRIQRFDFEDRTDVRLDRPVVSEPVVVSGFAGTQPIRVSGHPTAAYSVNGGDFTNAPGTVVAGDTVRLRLRSPREYGRTRHAFIEIGGLSDRWGVASAPVDVTPYGFAFPDRLVGQNETAYSDGVRITGINVPVQAYAGGDPSAQLSVNGGAYGSAPVTVSAGDTLRLRVDAPAAPGQTLAPTLTVGDTTAIWTVVTTDEVEPNDRCETATALADPLAPHTGSRHSPDIDFYRVDLTAGATYTLKLRGAHSGAGTQDDPLIGAFDSGCTRLAYDDDGGVGYDSRLEISVPADGVLVIAASGYPDFDFDGAGGSGGSYTLEIVEGALAAVADERPDDRKARPAR